MLDGLDEIEWETLTHAYGSAEDVPALLRALRSDDEEERDSALHALYGNIFHQGTRYQATPHAVPFVRELVEARDTPARGRLVYYLINLALGYEEAYLPAGVDAPRLRNYYKDAIQRMSEEERAYCDEYGFGPRVELDCYDAVEQCCPTFRALAVGADRDLAIAAIFALAWFPDERAASLRVIQRALDDRRDDDAFVANALLAMGLLADEQDEEVTAALRAALDDDEPLIACCAALALTRQGLDARQLDLLVFALSDEQLIERGRELPFNNGDLTGYISRALSASGAQARERIVPALCEAMVGLNAMRSIDVTAALLNLVIPEDLDAVEDIDPHELDPLIVMALRAIAEHGGWYVGDSHFANYSNMMRNWGLPARREVLQEYLAPLEEE